MKTKPPLTSLTAALVISLIAETGANAQIISTFDTDDDGWIFVDIIETDAPPLATHTPSYSVTNGNPGGYISLIDPGPGPTSYFQAPSRLLGSRSNYYGGSLSFDVRRHGGTLISIGADVILVGAGLTLVIDAGLGPAADVWTSYSVPLSTSSNWHTGTLTGAPPSEVQFQAVLGDLTAIRIRGEYSAIANDTGGLDNVVFSPYRTCPQSTIHISQVQVCWDSKVGDLYQVQYRSALTTNVWVDFGGNITGMGTPICVSDGVAAGQLQKYYRVVCLTH